MKHHCHWNGCKKEVPPKMWGCRAHWFALPKIFRNAVWRYYVPKQEITKTPSKHYLAVVTAIEAWIVVYEECDTKEKRERIMSNFACKLALDDAAKLFGISFSRSDKNATE